MKSHQTDTLKNWETVVTASPDAIVVVDRSLTVTHWNPAAEEIFGWTAEEALGEPNPAVPEVKRDAYESTIKDVLGGNEVTGRETKRQRKDDSLVDVSISTAPVTGPDGEIVAAMAVGKDISERKSHERRMEALQYAIRALMTSTTDTEIAEQVVTTGEQILGMSRVGVHLYEASSQALVPVAWSGDIETDIGEPPTLGSDSLAWDVFTDDTTQEFSDLWATSDRYNSDTPFRSELIVPLDGHGVVLVSSTEPDDFTDRDRLLVDALCANATAALDRVQRERDLRGYKEAVEHAGHSIVITDTDGRIEYVNPAFEEITGYTETEALGTNPRILKSGEHDESFYEQLWTTIKNGEIWHAEIVNERKDGEQFVVDQTIAPIFDEGGEIERFVAINSDVTEQKELERRLKTQRDNLEVLNQVVRHDIRNDLQLVLSYVELLRDLVDDEGRSHVETALESARNAVGLTKTARDLAEVMLQAETEPSPVPLRPALESQLETIRSTYDDVAITVADPIPAVRVRATEMLDSVFRNILKNAVQHNDAPTAEISVRVTADDDTVVVRIADNGPGVPDDRKTEIFGKGKKGLESDGTGIGLYLVHTLVDTYGGDVWVEDRTTQECETNQSATASNAQSSDGPPEGAVFAVKLQRAE
ncbi:PAS domain S-box protein [Halorientalis brevis]|uniref:histidine kinase n=1 Tax=Halorientalis brevis TaxID=1126241 RepID=A0ABD6CHU0_9EURY|nr:PAS domain S-box protein [Halorientalis brevis]